MFYTRNVQGMCLYPLRSLLSECLGAELRSWDEQHYHCINTVDTTIHRRAINKQQESVYVVEAKHLEAMQGK